MGLGTERFQMRQNAKQVLANIIKNAKSVILIHYSCESFYDRPNGASPRITSIAVRNLASGQTASFSIHQVAERDGVAHDEIEQEYNRLEKMMLKEFYQYVAAHKDCTWLHWNMRDINYGFAALAHRCKVLGGTPVELHESNLCDFARLLIALYGPGYVGHPRLTNLMKVNSISAKDFLTGQQEAEAFEQKEYVKLHQSTLRKVDVISNVVGRLAAGTLKTNASWREVHGSWVGYMGELVRDHPIMLIITSLSSISGIVGLILWFI